MKDNDIAFLLYNLAILGTAVWLIGWHEWSPWWFLVAMMCCAGKSSEDEACDVCECDCDSNADDDDKEKK